MKLPIFVLLPALVTIAGAWTINSDGRIANFIWPKDSKDLTSFNSRESVIFSGGYFENFSRAIGDQLTNMKELQFIDGTVRQIYLKYNIQALTVRSANTENIEIDPDEEYAIVQLVVIVCKLTRIPPNINRLRRLTHLDIGNNKIDYIKMSDFNGLNNLKTLHLEYNRIKTLSSETTIHLPNLRELSLYNNDLQEINVCSWDMPILKRLYFHNNKLKFIVNLVDQFPKLQKITAFNNPLVCPWMDDLVRSLKSKNIQQVTWYNEDKKITCNASDKTHVPIECPSVYSLINQLSILSDMSTNRIESLEQMMKKLKDENQSLRQTISTNTDQLTKLRSFERNLTEKMNQLMKQLTDENQSLRQTISTITDQQRSFEQSTEKIDQMMKTLKDENLSLKTELTELRHSIDDVTEGFYQYVLKKEGGEK